MSTLQSENTLIISRSNNRTTNLTVNDTGSTSGVNTDILLPDINYDYHKTANSELDNDKNSQFLITSSNQPKNVSGLTSAQNLILKYVKSGSTGTDGSVKWVTESQDTGRNLNNEVSKNITRTLPLGDFYTDIQTNVDNFETSTNDDDMDNKYKWINLNAAIIDIGLQQLTWNVNKQYYHLLDNDNQNSTLNIFCSNPDDNNLNLKINYLTTDSDKEETKYICNISNYNKNISAVGINCYKINSAEIIANTNLNTHNKGDIELYFKMHNLSQGNLN